MFSSSSLRQARISYQGHHICRARSGKNIGLVLSDQQVGHMMNEMDDDATVSTSILGRRAAPFPPFRITYRVPHGFTPRSWYWPDPQILVLGAGHDRVQ